MKKIIIGIFILALLGITTYGLNIRNSQQEIYSKKISLAQEEKAKLLRHYSERADLLINWEAQIIQKLGETHVPKNLRLPAIVSESKNLSLNSRTEAKRFDFVQNQISQIMSLYLNSKEALSLKPINLERIDESINRARTAYHVAAFEAIEINDQYWLRQKNPLVFEVEKMLYDKGLFSKK